MLGDTGRRAVRLRLERNSCHDMEWNLFYVTLYSTVKC